MQVPCNTWSLILQYWNQIFAAVFNGGDKMIGKELNISTILPFWSSKIKIYFVSQNHLIEYASLPPVLILKHLSLALSPVIYMLYVWEIASMQHRDPWAKLGVGAANWVHHRTWRQQLTLPLCGQKSWLPPLLWHIHRDTASKKFTLSLADDIACATTRDILGCNRFWKCCCQAYFKTPKSHD